MLEDLFLQLLMKHSVTRLRELRAEADEKIRQGELEGGYIDRALELKNATEPQRPLSAHRNEAASARKLSVPKPGQTRDPVKKIVASDPSRVWMPADVRDELADRFHLAVATNTVRAVMKRLLDDGFFARPHGEKNGFKLASPTSGSTEPFVVEASENGSGEPLSTATQPQRGT